MSTKLKTIIAVVIIAIIGVLTGVGVNININQEGQAETVVETKKATIEYSEEQVPAIVTVEESGQGAIETEMTEFNGQEIPTVETVESTGPVTEVNEQECPEGEECGRGAAYPAIDISSPQAFTDATIGQCIDVDGYYGAQCWDLMAAFWYNYTGRTLTTCGTGAAKGAIADGCWQQNAGNEFTMVWDPREIQDGDIAFYSTGTWGHTGMARGGYNNGYFALFGQNQGGMSCWNGGSAGNIINLSTRDFIGAFRPNIYIKPAPAPEPEPAPVDTCTVREVVKGDTLGKIMQECQGEIKWGEDMNEYARHWVSTKVNPGNTVFYGWTHGTGYGLWYGDVIEYKAE